MDLELMAVRVQEVQRLALAAILLPDLSTRFDDRRSDRGELVRTHVKGDVRVVVTASRLRRALDERHPELTGEDIGTLRPLGQQAAPQHIAIERDRGLDIRGRERHMVDSPDAHDAIVSVGAY